MTIRTIELYDALIMAGVDEDKARERAAKIVA